MKRLLLVLYASMLAVALAISASGSWFASDVYAAQGAVHLHTTSGVFSLHNPPPGDTGLRNYTVTSVDNQTNSLVRVYRNANCTGALISIPAGESRGGFPFAPQCLRVY